MCLRRRGGSTSAPDSTWWRNRRTEASGTISSGRSGRRTFEEGAAMAEIDKQSYRVVPLGPEHRPDWERLYAGYAAFYKVEQTPQMRETVWRWIFDEDNELE